MDPPHSWDGIGNGATGDEDLDNILSILDFPMESLEADGLAGDWDASKSQYLGPIPSDDVLMGPPVVSVSNGKPEPKHPILFPMPFAPPVSSIKLEAATETKPPLYQFSDSSGSNISRQNKCAEVQEHGGFQSRSPVSVLESSASSLVASGRTILTKFRISKRTRSRRARPLGCNPWLLISVPITPSSGKSRKIKATRKKPAQSAPCAMAIVSQHSSYDSVETQNAGVVKKCSHCEVTKTPQWREGPVGPKTLCNACGVRYRSGRLFPEYRPAASPTFVPAIHSNSHKKVLEMRNKGKM